MSRYNLKLSPVKKLLCRSPKCIWPCEHRNLSGAECFKKPFGKRTGYVNNRAFGKRTGYVNNRGGARR